MSTATRNAIRREVLKYLRTSRRPVRVSTVATKLREQPKLNAVSDSDVRAVVQPMIVTGKLSYAPGLKITLGHANE